MRALDKVIIPKMHLIVSNNDLRPAMCNVLITKLNGKPVAVATDGHVIALVEIESFQLVQNDIESYPKLVSGFTWQQMIKANFVGFREDKIFVINKGIHVSHPYVEGLTYPKVEIVLKTVRDKAKSFSIKENPVIGFNPVLLYRLYQVLNFDGSLHNVSHHVNSGASGHVMFGNALDDRFGVIMPLFLEESVTSSISILEKFIDSEVEA